MFMSPSFPENSGVTLFFEHSPSWTSEIDYFEIFSRRREFSFEYINPYVILY